VNFARAGFDIANAEKSFRARECIGGAHKSEHCLSDDSAKARIECASGRLPNYQPMCAQWHRLC
jgi:hypothetical protein